MKKLLYLVFILFKSFLLLHAQNDYLKFTDLLNKKDLTSSYTTCIAQDKLGFIWIGTQTGLNRFDGYEVRQYFYNYNDSTSLPYDDIVDLHIDNDEKLWVVTKQGICWYNPELDNFKTISDVNNLAGLPAINCTKIKSGVNNKIYTAVNEYLCTYNKKLKSFQIELKIDKGLISNFLFDIDSSIWIGARQGGGVYHYSKEKKLINHYTEASSPKGLSSDEVTDIDIRDRELWIATLGGGVNALNILNNKVKHIPVPHDYAEFVANIYIDNTNKVWAVDYTGLKEYNKEENKLNAYYYNKYDKFTLKPTVIDIFQDRQGIYWTLHAPHGVGQSIPYNGFRYFNNEVTRYWKTSNNSISAIAEDSKGNLWLGNSSNGIDIFYWSEGKIITYNHRENDPFSLGKGTVNVIKRDSKGVMWVGTHQGGLQYFEPETERFITYRYDPDDDSSLSDNSVSDIVEDLSGNLWISTNGKGINVFNPETGNFKHLNTANSNLSNDYVFDILIDNEENIWAATSWNLSVLKKGAKRFNSYFSISQDSTTISNNEIICLHQDKKNQIWVGTPRGLNLFNKDSNNFKRIDFGVETNYICGILSDFDSNLWISTLNGLIYYNTTNNTYINYNTEDGLSSDEYNVRAVFDTDENSFFFGGVGGVDLVSPDNLKFNTDTPKVFLTDFKLFYKSVTNYSPDAALQKNIIYTNQIKLNYDQNIIGFKFAALNFNQPQKNQYAYKMEGFDKDWVYCGTNREVTYTNLNPGKYTFRVKASNNDGLWNEKGTSLKLIIIPPWWETWWFRLISVILIFIIITGAYYYRIIRLYKQKERLTNIVNEKTEALHQKNKVLIEQTENLNEANAQLEERQQFIEEQSEELKAEVENNELLIKELQKTNLTKDKMFSIISHDLRAPLGNLMGFSDILTESYNELETEQKKQMISAIGVSSRNLYTLLENLLKWARAQTGEIAYSPEFHKIGDLIKNIDDIFESSLKQKEITYHKATNDNQQVYVDSDMIQTVIRNLLSNAIKYTNKGGTINIEGQKLNNFYELKIIDSGVGIPDEIKDNLFLFDNNKVRTGTGGEGGSGLGLVLCKEFVVRNNGELRVESIIGKGTTFKFTMPLSSEL